MRTLVVTADDFGLALPVNEAVEEAHRSGVLTAASLIVGAPQMEDAVERARRMPTLGVGLHLTLVDGRPVLPPEQVHGLVGSDGRFSTDPVRAGIALYFSRELRRQAEREIAAQFERFHATGLPIDHVNGHLHFHMHPVIAGAIARLAPAYGAPPVRIPVEPFANSYAAAQDRPFGRLGLWLFNLMQTRSMRRRLAAAGLPFNDYIFGLNDSGGMTEARTLAFLDNLAEGITEIYFHPATRRWPGLDNLPAWYKPEEEFAALVSPAVKAKIAAAGVTAATFRAATQGARAAHRSEAVA